MDSKCYGQLGSLSTLTIRWLTLFSGRRLQRFVTTELFSSVLTAATSALLFLLLWVVLSSSHFLVLDDSASCMSALFQASPPVQSCVARIQSAHVCWQFLFIQPVVLPRLLCSLGAGSACDTVKGRSQKVARTSTRSPRDAWVILGVVVTELLRSAGSGCRVMSCRRGLMARRLVRRCQGPVGRGVSPQQQASLWSVAGVGCAREDA